MRKMNEPWDKITLLAENAVLRAQVEAAINVRDGALARVEQLKRERDSEHRVVLLRETECARLLGRAERAEKKLAEWESEDAPAQAYERLAHQRHEEAKAATERAERAEKQLADSLERLDAGTLHRLVCNADPSKPTGGDMCICNPLKSRLAKVVEAACRGICEKCKGREAPDGHEACQAAQVILAAARAEAPEPVCSAGVKGCGILHDEHGHEAPEPKTWGYDTELGEHGDPK